MLQHSKVQHLDLWCRGCSPYPFVLWLQHHLIRCLCKSRYFLKLFLTTLFFSLWGHTWRTFLKLLFGKLLFLKAHLKNFFETCFWQKKFFEDTLEELLWNLFLIILFFPLSNRAHLKDAFETFFDKSFFGGHTWGTSLKFFYYIFLFLLRWNYLSGVFHIRLFFHFHLWELHFSFPLISGFFFFFFLLNLPTYFQFHWWELLWFSFVFLTCFPFSFFSKVFHFFLHFFKWVSHLFLVISFLVFFKIIIRAFYFVIGFFS